MDDMHGGVEASTEKRGVPLEVSHIYPATLHLLIRLSATTYDPLFFMRAYFLFLIVSAFLLSSCRHTEPTLRDRLLEVEMIYIEGGTFEIGDVFEGKNTDAIPVHSVTLASFYLSKYEVTFAQYDTFALATGRPLPDDDGKGRGNRAVAQVDWDDALAFCEAYGYRLPSEAEWEYAARDRGQKMLYAGTNNVDDLPNYAHLDGAYANYSLAVNERLPNALGLHDMSGNVAEWIGDYYQFYPDPDSLPVYSDLETSGIRILRGGSFNHATEVMRTYWRAGTLRDVTSNAFGFRCAATAE